MNSQTPFLQVAAIGIGATALMDLWLLAQARLGLAPSNVAMIGRWVGHLARGRLAHAAIGRAAPVRHEQALGWLTHYAVGIAFAAALAGLAGAPWLQRPSPWPALAFGLATVAAPWLVMQPAMGAGIAARRSGAPLRNALRSLANHAVFGLGLYAAAALLAAI
ncbi:MAG: DUF2938 family protein [Burkholderiaceae bacterium]|nr:DUF2938 family protein [Burkholderiaceae bacterium]